MTEHHQPAAPQQQPPAPVQTMPIENPGQTMGIIGLVLNILGICVGGIILGALSMSKSKQANMSTALGLISLIWGIVGTAGAILGFGFFILMAVISAGAGGSHF